MNSRDFNNLMAAAKLRVRDNSEHVVATKQLADSYVEFYINSHYEDRDAITIGMWHSKLLRSHNVILKTENGLRKMMSLYDIL